MDISNKTLALVLVVALVVSMTGTLLSLNRLQSIGIRGITGRAGSDQGNVTLTVSSAASLIFRINAINFGSGTINTSAGVNNCTMDSMGNRNAGCASFTTVTQGLVLENDGNENLSVTMNSTVNSTDFIGGTIEGGPLFQWNITNNESTSCKTGLYAGNGTFVDVNKSQMDICSDFVWQDTVDSILVHVLVRIPSDSLTGQRNATFLAVGTQN